MAGEILWENTSLLLMNISAETPSLIVLSLLSTLISTLKVLVFLSAEVAIKETLPCISSPDIKRAIELAPTSKSAISFSAISATNSMGLESIREAQVPPVFK